MTAELARSPSSGRADRPLALERSLRHSTEQKMPAPPRASVNPNWLKSVAAQKAEPPRNKEPTPKRWADSGCSSQAGTDDSESASSASSTSRLAKVCGDGGSGAGAMCAGPIRLSPDVAAAMTGTAAALAGATCAGPVFAGITIFGPEARGLGGLIITVSVNRFRQRGHSELDPSR